MLWFRLILAFIFLSAAKVQLSSQAQLPSSAVGARLKWSARVVECRAEGRINRGERQWWWVKSAPLVVIVSGLPSPQILTTWVALQQLLTSSLGLKSLRLGPLWVWTVTEQKDHRFKDYLYKAAEVFFLRHNYMFLDIQGLTPPPPS